MMLTHQQRVIGASTLLLCAMMTGALQSVLYSQDQPKSSSHSRSDRYLYITFEGDRTNVSDVMNDFMATASTPIVQDRRLNPHFELTLEPRLEGTPETILQQICANNPLAYRMIGESYVIGHEKDLLPLRTTIHLQTNELRSRIKDYGPTMMKKLVNRRSFHWDRLDSPHEILDRLVRENQIQIEGEELVPHDLWRSADLEDVNVIDVLALVLNQFDLTFQWLEATPGVRIIQQESFPLLNRSLKIKSLEKRNRIQQLAATFPRVDIVETSSLLKVTGPLEFFELVDQLDRQASQKMIPKKTQAEWMKREFTLRVQRKRFRDVVEYLNQSGLKLLCDYEQLSSEGFSPDQLIDLELDRANLEQLCEALSRPIGVSFRIEADQVRFFPPAQREKGNQENP